MRSTLAKWTLLAVCSLVPACGNGSSQSARPDPVRAEATGEAVEVGAAVPSSPPACEWCGVREAPALAAARVELAAAAEPGERMVISGEVHRADAAPAAGVTLYVYQTNAAGIYARRGNETGNGVRHGYLRGWIRTGDRGGYEIDTIRPGSYPNSTQAAHIHVTVLDAGAENWLDDFVFAGDPHLAGHLANARSVGGSGVVTLTRDAAGTWRGQRRIVLPPTPPENAVR
jgi:protocatechuate 3,4-dioxygenase beta subunit